MDPYALYRAVMPSSRFVNLKSCDGTPQIVTLGARLVLAALREHFELRRALAAWRGGQGQRVLDGTLALPCDQLLVLYTECAQLANVASGAQVSKLDHARVAE